MAPYKELTRDYPEISRPFSPGPLQMQWISALRSGHCQQGTTYLKEDSTGKVRHTCRGVAADLWNPYGQHWDDGIFSFQDLREDGKHHLTRHGLPGQTQKKLAMCDPTGVFVIHRRVTEMVIKGKKAYALCDIEDRMTFDEIADFIEDNAQFLFYKPV